MSGQSKQSDSDPIQHIVVLMLENHSFDQMLGDFQSIYKELDGIDRNAPRRSNVDGAGNVFEQLPTTTRSVNPDPHHELEHVLRQIEASLPQTHWFTPMHRIWRGLLALLTIAYSWLRPQRKTVQAMRAAAAYRGAFVADYVDSYKAVHRLNPREIMGYYERGTLPALHTLADHFTICDHWFSSVPGPTWANRFFVHSGTSLGIARMPEYNSQVFNYDLYDQPTLYDRLNEQHIPWRIYYHDVPQSFLLVNQLHRENKRCYRKIDHFEQDVAGPEESFPKYVFIEPQYLEPDPNDDHPPYDVYAAQTLIARVYNAIRGNEALWHRTLLVIVYDEHGGFYDHVSPPAAVAPDGSPGREYTFTQLGVRVPAVLVSPWVKAGVFSETLDHTSLLRYLSDRWNLGPLGQRVAQAKSFAAAIDTTNAPRTDTPQTIPAGPPTGAAKAAEAPGPKETGMLNENQQGLAKLAEHLDHKASVQLGAESKRVQMRGATPPSTHTSGAAVRVERFLEAD